MKSFLDHLGNHSSQEQEDQEFFHNTVAVIAVRDLSYREIAESRKTSPKNVEALMIMYGLTEEKKYFTTEEFLNHTEWKRANSFRHLKILKDTGFIFQVVQTRYAFTPKGEKLITATIQRIEDNAYEFLKGS